MKDRIQNYLKTLNLKKLVYLFLGIFLLSFIFSIFYKLPTPDKLKNFQATPLSTQILDRNGKLLYEIYHEQNRTPIKLKNLPLYVAKATIAIEDKDFYKHGGGSQLLAESSAPSKICFSLNRSKAGQPSLNN